MKTNTSGIFSVVATPIGNRGDLSPRAKEKILNADLIIAEDTRSLRTLLGDSHAKGEILRGDAKMEKLAAGKALSALSLGRNVVFLTDAGTPGISDPGARIVDMLRASLSEIVIEAIPGPSALTAGLSISGIPAMPFTFFGFPPVKKGRQTFFKTIAENPYTSVLYESPHRIIKTLTEIKNSASEQRIVFVGRELTKMHEEGIRGTVLELLTYYTLHPDKVRGEFVIVVEAKKK